MKTLEEFKTEISLECEGYSNFNRLFGRYDYEHVAKLMDKAAERYAAQFKRFDEDKIKELLQWCWMDCKNRHRLYPEGSHTFSDWWAVSKDNILGNYILIHPLKIG